MKNGRKKSDYEVADSNPEICKLNHLSDEVGDSMQIDTRKKEIEMMGDLLIDAKVKESVMIEFLKANKIKVPYFKI
jgi:hypothetical protein